MRLLKELTWSLSVLLLLYASYALSAFLDMPLSKEASIPSFKNQAFCFSILPLQVLQSLVLEQQLESKDQTVQTALKKMAQQLQNQPNNQLADFGFELSGAVAYYLIDHPKKQFSSLYLPGSGQAPGWQASTYYGMQQGVFVFMEKLSAQEQAYFEESLAGLRFKTKKFKAREHTFELHRQTYTLNWEKHAFSLELPKTSKQAISMLQPNGFHMSSPLALSNLATSYRFLEQIKASSINYYGAKLNSKQALALEFEALLTFDTARQRKEFLAAAKRVFADWQWAPNFVRVNNSIYALKNEGPTQLYICSSPNKYIENGQIKSQKSTSPIVCAGNPTLLTKLDNAGWAAAILELFPIYRGISDFSARTAKVSTNKQTIRWELKTEYYAAGEFLKLVSTVVEP